MANDKSFLHGTSIEKEQSLDRNYLIKQEIRYLEAKRAKQGLYISEQKKLAGLYKMLQQKLPFGEIK